MLKRCVIGVENRTDKVFSSRTAEHSDHSPTVDTIFAFGFA